MPDPAVLFHVGYHKTGTTWMQRRLFRAAHGFAPFGEDIDETHRAVFAHVTKPHRLAFDAPAARSALLGRFAGGTGGRVPVVSSEILSGHPFWGGRDSADFAERLHAIAPDARILLTIRAQIPAIASVYMQYVRRGGTLSPARFYDGARVLGYDGFDPVHFEYHRLVAHYQALFGADRVKVMTQEALAADPAAFVAGLAAFTGAPAAPVPSTQREGASESEAATPILRRINHFVFDGANPSPILDLGPLSAGAYRGTGWAFRRLKGAGLATGRPVTAEAKRRFAGRFAASNRALAEMCAGLDLPGYEI